MRHFLVAADDDEVFTLEVVACDRCGVLTVTTDAERHADWHDRVAMRETL